MAVSREEVINRLQALVRDRGPWYIERLQVSDSNGNRYIPEVGTDGAVDLILRSGGSKRRR